MSSRFPTCFHPSTASPATVYGGTAAELAAISPPPPPSGNANLSTSLYHTHHGIFALTWTRHRLSRTLCLHFRLSHGVDTAPPSPPSLFAASFRLQIKPLLFWTKRGSKKLAGDETGGRSVRVFWDLAGAEFGSGPEPRSGFYIAVVVDGEMALLVGDSRKQAHARTRASANEERRSQILTMKKENVLGNRIYTTRARIGGRSREISIDCRSTEDPGLCISVDRKRVLQIKRLKWKFRGNERIEVDGVAIQFSWDVYNWVFEDASEGHAVFMFRLEKQESEIVEEGEDEKNPRFHVNLPNSMWSDRFWGFGIDGLEEERKKMSGKKLNKKKKKKKSGKSSSSSSLSSASSSGGSSSVMEWGSMEEDELKGPSAGFSLLVYAWKS